MMNEQQKSDSTVVAGKPANKACMKGAAEWVEPRVGTKENAGKQSTCRAQNRNCVEQALDRIRKVAKEKPKEKFTALMHHITLELLRDSFMALKRNAAAGADGVKWKDYEMRTGGQPRGST